MVRRKLCELCKVSPAIIHCPSDEATLCWQCDSKVHSTNFLVEKHTRTLLCHACGSFTPWTGPGDVLGPTVTVCIACHAAHGGVTLEGLKDSHTNNGGSSNEDDSQVVPLFNKVD